jgi:hypothetical protein
MYIKEINFDRVSELHGEPDISLSIEIQPGHPYMRLVKEGMREDGDFEKAVRLWNELGIKGFTDSISNPALRDKAERLTRPYPANTGAFSEAVINAIEHGSEFGKNGGVVIGLQANSNSFLLYVLDNGQGFPGESIEISKKNPDSNRGNGLVNLKRCPAIVTCDNGRDYFRVALMSMI